MKLTKIFSPANLLIIFGLLLIVVSYCYMVYSSNMDFTYVDIETQRDLADFFNKNVNPSEMGDVDQLNKNSTLSLPNGLTPEIISKFMVTQARINNDLYHPNDAIIWVSLATWILQAIGWVALLLGLSQRSLERKLDNLIGK